MKTPTKSNLDIRPYDQSTVAALLNTQLTQAVHANGQAILAIPGGRSPAPVLTALAKAMDPATLDSTALIWLDERWVPPNHPDRNDVPTLKAWLRGGELPGMVLPMPSSNLFDNPQLAATWYNETLVDLTGPEPFLDAALIGIGEDGHFASLFPNHPELYLGIDGDLDQKTTGTSAPSPHNLVFVCSDSPKPPATRLSLTLCLIRNTDLKVVLVLGKEKGGVLKRGLQNPGPHIPISLLFDDPSVVFFLDSDALGAMDAQ